MTNYEGFSDNDGNMVKQSLEKFNQQYSNYTRNENLNGWNGSGSLEHFLTIDRGGEVVEGYVPSVAPASDPIVVHNQVLSLQSDIDNKLNELQQNEGSIAAEKQKYTDGLTYTAIIWASVTSTLLYFTFVKL
jgi:hypothetical protein